MYKYDPKSLKADEFINDGEILDTLKYAEENKNNIELIDSILEKAKPRRTPEGIFCTGLNHREASVLLACENKEIIEKMYALAREIKQTFYGNRIVMFAPLYLSNYCVNGCVYCPYHMQNKHIARKKLTQEEVKAEVIALQDMGHKRLAIEAGEDPKNNPIEYILECIDTIYSIKHKNGAIRRVNVNIAATTQLKVVVVSIEEFDEAREVADHLRSKKPVVINLEKLEKDVARRVIDFISGGVYALGGSIQKVSGGIFLIAPYNVDIMSDVRDELKNTGIFPWEE